MAYQYSPDEELKRLKAQQIDPFQSALAPTGNVGAAPAVQPQPQPVPAATAPVPTVAPVTPQPVVAPPGATPFPGTLPGGIPQPNALPTSPRALLPDELDPFKRRRTASV